MFGRVESFDRIVAAKVTAVKGAGQHDDKGAGEEWDEDLTIFVMNLANDVAFEQLIEHFETFGQIMMAKAFKEIEGHVCFIQFKDQDLLPTQEYTNGTLPKSQPTSFCQH
jgi:RNA recognition motif-containing protein